MQAGKLQNKMIKWQEPSPESDSVCTQVLKELKDKIVVIGNVWCKITMGLENFFQVFWFN